MACIFAIVNDFYIYIFIHHQMVTTYTYTHNQKTENILNNIIHTYMHMYIININ